MIAKPINPLAWLVLLGIRGVLLWLVVPLSFLVWLIGGFWLWSDRAPLGRFMGWIDSNLVFSLERTILRPVFPEPTHKWVPFASVSTVTHRIGHLDFI